MNNIVDEREVRTPELADYLALLTRLERLEARIEELERRLLDRTDGVRH
jgi:hypothetical protein